MKKTCVTKTSHGAFWMSKWFFCENMKVVNGHAYKPHCVCLHDLASFRKLFLKIRSAYRVCGSLHECQRNKTRKQGRMSFIYTIRLLNTIKFLNLKTFFFFASTKQNLSESEAEQYSFQPQR